MRFLLTITFIAFFALPAFAAETQKVDAFETPLETIKQLADQGDHAAENAMGLIYSEGLRGLPLDDKLAVDWFRKAAEGGYSRAQINLGGMYARGKGVAQDDEEAYFWYRLGRKFGAPSAHVFIEEGEKKLTRKQIEAIGKKADAWQPPLPPPTKL